MSSPDDFGQRDGCSVRETTDGKNPIDVREIARFGVLDDQDHARVLTWKLNDEPRGSALAWYDGTHLLLMYVVRDNETGEEAEHAREIQVEWLPAQLGGRRPWFRCPSCHRRCAVLYVWIEAACRRCHGFAYESQRARKDATGAAAEEFRAGQELLASVMVPGKRFVKRPGVRWVTYHRTIAKALGLMESAVARLDEQRKR